jgi:hypothetical protein
MDDESSLPRRPAILGGLGCPVGKQRVAEVRGMRMSVVMRKEFTGAR